jgi:hypothetical protein
MSNSIIIMSKLNSKKKRVDFNKKKIFRENEQGFRFIQFYQLKNNNKNKYEIT